MEVNCVEIFGKRLKDLRTKKGLSQKQLGDAIGISKSTVGSYECAERTPAIEILAKTAKYFDVSLDYLLGNTTAEKKENSYACDNLGLSEISAENIRAITRSGDNVNILLERDEIKSIVELLNKIKTITVGQRYYDERIIPNIENNYLLGSLFNNSEFQAHSKLLSYIKYATTQIIERQFSGDMLISNSMIESPENCDELYKERLVLTEYKLTEFVFRTMINDIKNDKTTDNENFNEFDDQIGDNLDYLLLTLQSNLEDAPNRYTGNKLDKRKHEIQEDIELLSKFIRFYNEHYRKDGDLNG